MEPQTPTSIPQTGIDYPEVEIGGRKFVIRFSRGATLYRLSKSGTDPKDLNNILKGPGALIDFIHAGISDQVETTPEALAELILSSPQKTAECRRAVDAALLKVFPPAPKTPQAGQGKPEEKAENSPTEPTLQ